MTRHHPKPTLTLPGIERAPIDGDALGASWEAWLDAAVGVEQQREALYQQQLRDAYAQLEAQGQSGESEEHESREHEHDDDDDGEHSAFHFD